MKRIIYLAIALICATSINAQVRIGNNTEPHKGAVLDLKSTETETKGLLLPSVSLTDINSFLPVTGDKDAAAGMVVYNTNETIGKGVYVWDGDKWSKIADSNGNGDNGGGSVTSDCGAWADLSQAKWLVFQCYNLGATENGEPLEPAAAIHGAKYTWGSKTPILTQIVDQANETAPSGWTTPTANIDGSWTDSNKAVNDPCPDGWRVPTSGEWASVLASNTLSRVGTWTDVAANYTSGLEIGSSLFLPAAGLRSDNGAQINRGRIGSYWSSTVDGTSSAYTLYFGISVANGAHSNLRARGMSVRCVAE